MHNIKIFHVSTNYLEKSQIFNSKIKLFVKKKSHMFNIICII